VSGIIQELLREGVVVGWWDARSGHLNDLGPNGNNGVMSAGCFWEGFSLRFPTNADEVTVVNSASLQITTVTLVVFGRFNLNAVAYESLIAKRLVGASQFDFHGRSDRISLYDGTTQIHLVTPTTGARCLACSFTHGGTPVGYVNGLSRGNFVGTQNIIVNNHPVEIGNLSNARRLESPLDGALVISRVLTAAEHAQLYDELANLRWPSSCWGSAKVSQDVFKRDPDIVAGWNMRPSGLVVPDEIGANDGTIVGAILNEPGILGDSMRCGVTGSDEHYIAADGNEVAGGQFTYALWLKSPVSAAVQTALGEGNNAIFTQFLLLQAGLSLTQMSARIRDDAGNALNITEAATGAFSDGMWKRYVIVRNATHFILYRNGVLQGSLSTAAIGALTVNLRTLFNLRRTVVSAESFHGQLLDVECFDEAKDIDWIEADYQEGAQALQFETKFGFQVSPAAEGGVIGQTIGTRDSPLRAADAAFRGLIEAEEIDGRLHKVLRCTTAGKIYIPGSYFFDTTSVEACFGHFRCWLYKADASVITWKFAGTDLDAAANGYALVYGVDESVVITELGVADITFAGTASHSTWHQFDVARASDGAFDGYINESLFGSGNDLTITSSIGMLWDLDVGDKLGLGEL